MKAHFRRIERFFKWIRKNQIKCIIGACCLFMLPGAVRVFLISIAVILRYPWLWEPLLAGFAAGAVLYYGLIYHLPAIDRFEHNLTHAIVAFLFLRDITRFDLRGGGEVAWASGFGDRFGDDMIRLAPYYLPTLTVFLSLIYPLGLRKVPFFLDLAGMSLAYHTFSTAREMRSNWTKRPFQATWGGGRIATDIGTSGPVFSALFILTFTLIFHSLCLFLFIGGYRNLLPWHGIFWHTNTAFYRALFGWAW